MNSPEITAAKMICKSIDALNFNPRSRKGSDGYLQEKPACTNDFNPRSRKGSDMGLSRSGITEIISIHAPARGATAFKTLPHIQFCEIPHISVPDPTRNYFFPLCSAASFD